ncbi:hypothetical protein E2C01_016382 [Portunus trituberculatus]|uniref:Uncharacterized protein n=1 Tax=Portunus trituberculatus TaxID=210409 RepID=A0A5B7DPF6_PORTR|nr:hypothetical protein [Portunus trituberculatus]
MLPGHQHLPCSAAWASPRCSKAGNLQLTPGLYSTNNTSQVQGMEKVKASLAHWLHLVKIT